MKILITGGGTGGHFYPIIAVIDSLESIIEQEKIVNITITFMSDSPYDRELLRDRGINFKRVQAGKVRGYFSLLNISDSIKTFMGSIKAIWSIYLNFPDVVFSKGGYASFPAVFAARFLGIPLIIHESDVSFGKVNKWSSSFAKKIAISFSKTSSYLSEKNKSKIALTGNPVRKEFFIPKKETAKEDGRSFFELNDSAPVIFFIGGSQGAQKINNNVLDIINELTKDYHVIHQCGNKNMEEISSRSSVALEKSSYSYRYHPFPFLNGINLKMAYSAADLIISRAGSGSIFEIAASGLPAILVPLKNAAQDHQRENAYEYVRTGAAYVIEESNLTSHVLLSEIRRLMSDKKKLKEMEEAAYNFAKPDAAEKIARGIISVALEHE